MYNYHKKQNKASNVYECENRSLLRKAVKGDKSALRRASNRRATSIFRNGCTLLTLLLDIRPGSRYPVLLHAEAGSGRRRPPARENKWLQVYTSDPQSPRLPWLHVSDSAATDARPLYIRNSTPHEEFAHAWVRVPLRLSASSAFQAAPRKIITAESCIQMIKPITAANPP